MEGHTDKKGTADYNKRLGAARAAAVASWLRNHGIAKERLTSEGVGFARPIDTSDTEDARRNNRRVEFHIVGGPAPAPHR